LSHVSQFIDEVRSRSRDHDGDGDVDASTVPDDDELLDKLGLGEVKHQFMMLCLLHRTFSNEWLYIKAMEMSVEVNRF
jgi:hypothetical protein